MEATRHAGAEPATAGCRGPSLECAGDLGTAGRWGFEGEAQPPLASPMSDIGYAGSSHLTAPRSVPGRSILSLIFCPAVSPFTARIVFAVPPGVLSYPGALDPSSARTSVLSRLTCVRGSASSTSAGLSCSGSRFRSCRRQSLRVRQRDVIALASEPLPDCQVRSGRGVLRPRCGRVRDRHRRIIAVWSTRGAGVKAEAASGGGGAAAPPP